MKRDLRVIRDLERFRVMSRDDIIDLYFISLKNPITGANTVLKRLYRDGQIEVSKSFSPYVYFPANSTMKRNSTKIPHFLAIVDTYRHLMKGVHLTGFTVEPKFKKGLAEPDILAIIKGVPFFIEIQRNNYSQNVMNKKIKRYEALYYSNNPHFEDKFPFIIMVSDVKYEINSNILNVLQVETIQEFIQNINKKKVPGNAPKKIIYNIG